MSGFRLDKVAFSYDAPLLTQVDLEVEPGELVALVGTNGAGKSTALKLGAGLLVPDQGCATVSGEPVLALSPRERARRVALVPQGLARWPQTSTGTFVEGGRYAHGDRDSAVVRAALNATQLTELAERPVATLSGGQRQRALVARALAQESSVLLVDEPTAGLDPEHQLRVLELLIDAAKQGAAVLVATHELHLAVQFAQRIAVLEQGRLEAATTREVLASDVLQRVYGPHLRIGTFRDECVEGAVPLPWRKLER